MTQAQQLRIAGFNASISARGLIFRLDKFEFVGLAEDLGRGGSGNFEVTENDRRMFSDIHIANDASNVLSLNTGDVLVEYDRASNQPTGRQHTITDRKKHDIKVVFTCSTDYA
jgi:hypothetical protein